ncbi:MAG: sigma-70 family RNA polymerase sigma factor [Oscillospiraceae bacterium]|nr:sigma-70 family RNA polymerase sigma factor [Oscillospiraceae bacterium]
MNEAKLIAKLKKKNIGALERVIEIYTPYVSTIIRNALRGYISHEDLEELTADSFVALWEHAEDIRSEHLSGYIAQIAKSKAYNYMRKNIVLSESIEDVVIASDVNVEDEAEQQELSELLSKLLSELSDKEREIMLRFYYYRQTVSEISQEMDMNVSTVKTKLSRCRKKLRQKLQERGYCYEEMESF